MLRCRCGSLLGKVNKVSENSLTMEVTGLQKYKIHNANRHDKYIICMKCNAKIGSLQQNRMMISKEQCSIEEVNYEPSFLWKKEVEMTDLQSYMGLMGEIFDFCQEFQKGLKKIDERLEQLEPILPKLEHHVRMIKQAMKP